MLRSGDKISAIKHVKDVVVGHGLNDTDIALISVDPTPYEHSGRTFKMRFTVNNAAAERNAEVHYGMIRDDDPRFETILRDIHGGNFSSLLGANLVMPFNLNNTGRVSRVQVPQGGNPIYETTVTLPDFGRWYVIVMLRSGGHTSAVRYMEIDLDGEIHAPRYTVSGTVTLPDGNNAGQGTTVTLFNTAEPPVQRGSATTNAQGEFTIPNIMAGTYRLVAERVVNLHGGGERTNVVVSGANLTGQNITTKAADTYEISGTVIVPAGANPVGIPVQIWGVNDELLHTVYTETGGTFIFANVQEGLVHAPHTRRFRLAAQIHRAFAAPFGNGKRG
jgi:hypothetical protein